MIDKSLLRKKIDEVLDEREINDSDIAGDIIERLEAEGEVFDDEEDEEGADEEEGDEEY